MKKTSKNTLEKYLEQWKPDCYCEQDGTVFCGSCDCGKDGHTQSMPLIKPSGWCDLGEWCNDCAKKIIRMDHQGLSQQEITKALREQDTDQPKIT